MRRLLPFLLIFVAALSAVAVSAQTPVKLTVKSDRVGRLNVSNGKTRAVIDVGRNVSGCLYASAEIKRRVKDCAASPVDFHLVDATAKGGFTYLLVSTEAGGNCNVCGRCGATTAFGLIWLKLDKSLRAVDRKSTPLDFCLLDYTLLSDVIVHDDKTEIDRLVLKFDADGVLALDFEQQITPEKETDPRYEFSHLEYSRKNPEKGLAIKTEKRMKSSGQDN